MLKKSLGQVFILSFTWLGCHSAQAQNLFGDLLKTRTENKSVLAVYDLPGQHDIALVKGWVFTALTYQGDNAVMNDARVSAELPAHPGKMAFKEFSFGPVSMQIPQCQGAAFTISSSDASMAKWGDQSNYMACGFPYAGGQRISFYAQFRSTSGGVGGLLSGKTLGTMLASAIGFSGDPMTFIEASLTKLEAQIREAGSEPVLLEMVPLLGRREVQQDPLQQQKIALEKRQADRGKRLAARSELSKLGIDAADFNRFIRAVESGDEDLVALFLESGAVNPASRDVSGKLPLEYAQKASVRDLLKTQ